MYFMLVNCCVVMRMMSCFESATQESRFRNLLHSVHHTQTLNKLTLWKKDTTVDMQVLRTPILDCGPFWPVFIAKNNRILYSMPHSVHYIHTHAKFCPFTGPQHQYPHHCCGREVPDADRSHHEGCSNKLVGPQETSERHQTTGADICTQVSVQVTIQSKHSCDHDRARHRVSSL